MINSTIFMMNAANLEVLQLFKKIIVEIQDIEPTQSQLLSYSNDFGQ